MEAVELERNAIRKMVRRNHGKPIFEQTYAQRHAQASASGNAALLAIAGSGRGVDASDWEPIQDQTTGTIFFMVGYDAVGDPCHPISGGEAPASVSTPGG